MSNDSKCNGDQQTKKIIAWGDFFLMLFLILFGLFLGWLFFGFKKSEVPVSFTFNEFISLSISILLGAVSVVLGIFAIWLTLALKSESDSLNKETRELLTEIRIDAKTISSGVISEMEKWGDFGRANLAYQNTAQGDVSPIISKMEKWGDLGRVKNTSKGNASPIKYSGNEKKE